MSSATSSSGGAALLIGAALSGFDAGSIGYVMPAMRVATGADPQQASWLVSCYMIGVLAAIPACGAAVRRYGAAAVFRACAACAAIGALAAVLASDAATLLAARLVQGLGQGPLLPVAAAMIAVQFPVARQGGLMGGLSFAYGGAFLGGMAATPLLLQLDWRAAFAVSLAISLAALAAMRAAPRPRAPEARTTTPALARTRELAAIASLALGTGVGQAVVILLPTLAVQRLGVSPGGAGLLVLPLVAGGIAATLFIIAALDRHGARRLIAAGAILTLGGVLLAAAAPATHAGFLAGAGLLGLGITGLCGGPLRYAAARAVPAISQGPAQGAVALLTNVGVLGGSVLLGALAARGADERAALETAMLAACAVMAAAFLPVAALRAHARPAREIT